MDNSSIEKKELFYARASKWWDTSVLQSLIDLPARGGPYNVLAVSHSGWIGMLVRTLVSSKRLRTKEGVFIGKCFNTAVAMVELEVDGTGTVVKYGDISHLIQKGVETSVDDLQ